MCRLQPEGVPTLQPELASLVSAWLVSTGKRMRQEESQGAALALPQERTSGAEEVPPARFLPPQAPAG